MIGNGHVQFCSGRGRSNPPPDRNRLRPLTHNVGSGAMNVGRVHAPGSMILGQAGCSIASGTLN
jgi:hypothetical protein